MSVTTEKMSSIVDRSQWIRLLSKLDAEQVVAEVNTLSSGWQITPKSLPQSGLAMLKLEDSAYNEPFYLGEIPLATAWVDIVTPEGSNADGAAQVMGDNLEFVQALAVCDGILANRLPGYERIDELLRQGLEQCNREEQRRKNMLAATRVDFSLLDAVEDDDEN